MFQTAKEERSFSKGKKEVQVVEEEAEEKEEAEKEMEMEEWKADEPDDGSTRIKSGNYHQVWCLSSFLIFDSSSCIYDWIKYSKFESE